MLQKRLCRAFGAGLVPLVLLLFLGGCSETSSPSGDPSSSDIPVTYEVELTAPQPTAGTPFDDPFAALLTQAGQKRTKIAFPVGVFSLSRDHVVPETVTLELAKGCQFEVAADRRLTIQGTVLAPCGHIFAGEGTVDGRMKGTAYVQWFGADVLTDDHTPAFQKAVDACETVLVPDREAGYTITSLVLNQPVTLQGTGTNRVMLKIKDVSQRRFVTLHANDIRLENFTIDCFVNGHTSTELAVYFDSSDRDLTNITLKNVYINQPGYGIGDACLQEHTISNVTLDTVYITSNRNTGVHMTDFTTGIRLSDVCVSSFIYETPSKGYIFENIQEMHLENVDVLGGYDKAVRGGDGMTFRNCANVTCYRLMVDYVSGRQLVIQDSTNFHFSNFVTSLLTAEGLYLENFTHSTMDVIKANGGYPNSAPAVHMVGCAGLTFNDLIVQYSGHKGMTLDNCRDNIFNNTVILDGKSDSLVEASSCQNNRFNGLVCSGNKEAFSLQGTGSVINGFISDEGQAMGTVNSPYAS